LTLDVDVGIGASVDADLLAAAEAATRRGNARTLSAWVNDAFRLKLEHDRRMQALATFIDAYETEHGEISDAEIEQASRAARARALPVRALSARTRRTTRKRKAG
jgi:hypothetical protein